MRHVRHGLVRRVHGPRDMNRKVRLCVFEDKPVFCITFILSGCKIYYQLRAVNSAGKLQNGRVFRKKIPGCFDLRRLMTGHASGLIRLITSTPTQTYCAAVVVGVAHAIGQRMLSSDDTKSVPTESCLFRLRPAVYKKTNRGIFCHIRRHRPFHVAAICSCFCCV